jgi:hypothetical protein
LSKEEERDSLMLGCRNLETTALEVFGKSGWNIFRRVMN